ncbi:hypothetical protein NDU88_003634 [Pleurodeles waltl]|uniref:Uncharacterized protein n=1 Tax=Pleurodeles waltl TaxID=8319 RepID=A0AAV7VHY9_PLEWA|nr:hypothetical protein NDU88_003634 [Pleurodeles waltl]
MHRTSRRRRSTRSSRVIVQPDGTLSMDGRLREREEELAQQEVALNTLQHQIDKGDASEAESRVVRGRIGALWSRLDDYVSKDFRQRLYREGDRSGHMLAWLL